MITAGTEPRSWWQRVPWTSANRPRPRRHCAGGARSRSVLMCRTRLCGGGALTPARAGHGWIPPPHNISCPPCGRGIPLRRNAGGAQCSSSTFRTVGCLNAFVTG